jgi:hypothetical protein
MARTTFVDTSITVSTQTMVITDHSHNVASKQRLQIGSIKLPTSKEMKFAMGAATQESDKSSD